VRIDHFRALDEYYAIPIEAPTAKYGEWLPGPGLKFIKAIRKASPNLALVAEDLGIITDGVRKLLKDSGMPGMLVLLFAFDESRKSAYLPHNHKYHSIVYIGTHDNDTAIGWMQTGDKDEVAHAKSYLKLSDKEGFREGWLRALYSSRSNTAIAQMQDLLGLDNTARTNVPGTAGGNWSWRLEQGQIPDGLAKELRDMMKKHDRLQKSF
jgi:4-alpha-glucanotransferase